MANKIFDKVGISRPRYSSFDLSREQKLSCKMGDLIPTYLEEVIPGDQFSVNTEIMMRLAPLLSPVMHRVNVFMHFFFVPNRIIWNQWEEFITGGKDGLSDPTFPVFVQPLVQTGSLPDYLGIPTFSNDTVDATISQLPFRAYQQIYSDYYRDPNLTDEIDVNTANDTVLKTLRKRCWEKDYFTSALAEAQRGAAVGVPADINYKLNSDVVDSGTGAAVTGDLVAGTGGSLQTSGTSNEVRLENINNVDMDINELRKSSAIQRFLEHNMRAGYRYVEQLAARFGVTKQDARLQRAEYLGGGKQPIVISEVLSTTKTVNADDSLNNPVGEMAGHGIVTGAKNRFKYSVPEHGYIMGIMSVLPRTAYQQGIQRHWSRTDRLDYYAPEFANLGEQEVKNKEIYFDNTDNTYNEGTFGYQQRWAEMKYGCSTVHGDFRETLDFWHLGRIFGAQPTLSESFMKADPDTRIFAVEEGDHLWVQLYHSVKARRPMPYFADPRLT